MGNWLQIGRGVKNDMEKYELTIIIGLVCMCCVLIIRNMYYKIRLDEINKSLESIKTGDFNKRLRLYSSNKRLQGIADNLNSILDEFQDIVEKKEYLEESRKKMIANISHDLRTPLTSVLGYLEALRKDSKLCDEEKNHYLNIAYSKAQKLYSMLEEYFQFSKLEAEDVTIKVEKINLINIAQEMLVELYQEFQKKGIKPVIDIPYETLFVMGDSNALSRILSNLLNNSLHYGKKTIGLSMSKRDSMVWIDIWNDGAGIPERDIPYIFDRLYTIEPSRNEKLRGNGLGLAIVKKLVERLNGEILVESIPEEKTTFSFGLPLCK